ncbi:hypothetical protein M9H77_17263 [Catharanthus roseus]|uniref:Uncharacterized protein n=1 Tax=Catharanthus roseus TaxID=4058 RepID=A0ACC0B446_CATRO|nr:hypothetical protein M9H77_17263 [Catharanthus roseus]
MDTPKSSILLFSFLSILLFFKSVESAHDIPNDDFLKCLESQNSNSVSQVTPKSSSADSILQSLVRIFEHYQVPRSCQESSLPPSHESQIQEHYIVKRNMRFKLGKSELAFVAGTFPSVVVSGHFSGGGCSMMSRRFGQAADHIVDAKIIDVNGQILDRKSIGEDLFWAIRGVGGAAFGIITEWTPYFKGKSDYVQKQISKRGLEGIWKILLEEDVGQTQLQLTSYGRRLNDFSASSFPFPHRVGNIFMIHYIVGWDEEENAESGNHIAWIRRLYTYMTKYVSKSPRAAYFNYRDLDLGDNNIVGNTSYREARVWGAK